MKSIICLILLILSSCNFIGTTRTTQGKPTEIVCKMNDFNGFPKEVQGYLAFNLKTVVTIYIYNKDKTQRIDMTFKKKYCREVK